MKYALQFLIVFSLSLLTFTSDSHSADPEITPGLLASEGQFNSGSYILPQLADSAVPGEKTTVVTAMIEKKPPRKCSVTLSSIEKTDTVKLQLQFLRYPVAEGVQKQESFNATLKPQEKQVREFQCDPTDNIQVMLISGKRI